MIPFVFFGTSRISVIILSELKLKFNLVPALIVTTPDRPAGRKHELSPSPVKVWAESNKILLLQPESLKDSAFIGQLKQYELFIVASYGKIIPKEVLDLPTHGILNIHPSLLPKYRGASPIQNQILTNEKEVGTTIMLMDEEMDHGPIITQKNVSFGEDAFPALYNDVEEILAKESAELLSKVLPEWIEGNLHTLPQDHAAATYTKIIKKTDGEISLSDDPYKNYLKYLAYHEWPKVFFFFEHDGKKMRAVVTDAAFEDGSFIIKKLVPEGRKEMSNQEFTSWSQQ